MRRRAIAAAVAGAAAPAALFAWRWWQSEAEEQMHADRNETEVRIGMAHAACDIYQAGTGLDGARLVRRGVRDSAWMPAGSYFITVRDMHYPVPILGYRMGPDRDGSFVVTVRPAPTGQPPGDPGFAFIPSGHFLLGDRANPREPHYVWVPGFFIGIFEVTNAQFRHFYNDPSGFRRDANWSEAGRAWKARERSETSALLDPADPEYHRFGQPDQPVTSVTWFEAVAYCRWLTTHAGAGRWTFALPNDAEWEKAARGPDGFDYGLGPSISDAETALYNWKKNPDVPVTVIGWDQTRRSFRPNRYGIYHASGNVAEWTASAFLPYNRQQPYADDRRNHPDLAERRTVRGGSWYSATTAPLSLPYRDAFQPWHRGRDTGFRVAARLNP
jgi:formylglycine-generating enzyme required for sulfatase activity